MFGDNHCVNETNNSLENRTNNYILYVLSIINGAVTQSVGFSG